MNQTTIKQIEASIAKTIKIETNADIEVTNRGTGAWTVCGTQDAVQSAVQYLYTHNLMSLESMVHDDEIGETFAYLKSA